MDRYRAAHGRGSTPPRPRALTVPVGVVLGVLVSISSVGAGAVGVTALLLLYPRLPMARIVGSDIAHAVPLTLVAGIGHWAMGAVDWQLMGVAADGLAARHRHRQLLRGPRAGDGVAAGIGFRSDCSRRQACLQRTAAGVGSCHRCRREHHALEHDPEKWVPVFRKDHAQIKETERDDVSMKSHHALGAPWQFRARPTPRSSRRRSSNWSR